MPVRFPVFTASFAAALCVGASVAVRLPDERPRAAAAVSADGSIAAESRLLGRGDRKRVRAEVRRRIEEGGEGTYIADLLANRDSSLARWKERVDRPIRVWIQPQSAVKGWRVENVGLARAAFDDWESTGIPLKFAYVPDSARAEVHVTWVDRFREPISGRTLWARDDDWWILDGSISIAMHHRTGDPLDPAAIKAITLHEIGHLIGLDHTTDPATIMTPKVRVRALTLQDKATARLLYTLPAGGVR